MNYTAKPNLMKKPYANNVIPYREKMSVEQVAVVAVVILVVLTVTIILPIKVDLNKQRGNPSNKVTPDTNTQNHLLRKHRK